MSESREQFLKERRRYLGATDIAALLGVDPHKTALDVFNDKLGLVAPFEGNAHTKRGLKLEDIAAQEYAEATGRKVHRRRTELVHSKYDFIRGHLDRRVVGDKRPVEIKTPSRGMFAKIRRDGLPDAWIIQMQTYLWLDKSSVGDFAPFCPDAWEILPFEVEAQPELFEQIEHVAVMFWTEHVLKQIPPDPVKADAPMIEFNKIPGEVVRREDEAFVEAATLFREAKELERDAEELIGIAKDRMKQALEGKFGKYEGGGMRLSYYLSKGRTSFDKKSLAAAYPGIDLSRFEKQGDPFEVLKPVFLND